MLCAVPTHRVPTPDPSRVNSTAPAAPTGARILTFRADEEREFTSRVGMLVFLGSWAMMFGALFFSYALLRLRAPAWPPPDSPALPVGLPAAATGVMALSSLALWRATARLRADRIDAFVRWLLLATLLGLAFLALQAVAWAGLWATGLTTRSGPFGSVFYMLTAFHALHVVVGLLLLAWLLPRAARRLLSARSHPAATLVAMFWHFVGVVWLLIYATVYLL
jgi:cytochrome c oxidase subunit 3